MHSSIPSSLLNPAHISCPPPTVKVQAAALWLCGKSYFSLTCLSYSRDTNGLFPCTEFAKGPRPNRIFLDCFICTVVAFRMVETINSIAEKKRATQFFRLDRMLTENAPLFKTTGLLSLNLWWFTVGLDSVSEMYCHQMNSVKFDWTRSCWQMRAFNCGFQRNCWRLYICVCIFYSFIFSFPISFISGIWQRLILSVPNMRCADTFTHEWNNLQDYCYCTRWFLCRFLPVWTNLTSISSVFHCNSALNHK